jgi:hypothetical protein
MPVRADTVFCLLLATFLALPAPSRAQVGIPREGDRPSVQLEVAKPFFPDDMFGFSQEGFGPLTSILDATLAVPLGEGPVLFGRLGFAHATLSDQPSSSVLSNPRVGVAFGGQGRTSAELHVDLPLARELGDDDYATGVAIIADFEHFERWTPDLWAVGASVTPERVLEGGSVIGGRGGATLAIPEEGDSELLGLYAIYARLPAGSARIGGEISGLAIVSEADLNFAERTTFFLTVTGALPESALAPELYIRLPLDDDVSEALDLVAGVRVRFGG